MSTRARGTLIAIAWIGLVAVAAVYIHATLRVSGDLRLFLPAPHTRSEHLILEEVSAGPASRLLMVTLEGAGAPLLAASSRRLAAALRADSAFRLVANGANLLASIPPSLLPYRYLLSPTLDHHRFDAAYLHAQLLERERDLSSPAAGLLERWLPSDPTLETLKVLQSWQPPREPRLMDGVWFNDRGTEALMVVETTAPAFDPSAQQLALAKLHAHFEATRTAPSVKLDAAGPGAFSVLMQHRSEADARLASFLDTAGMAILMLLAYRSPALVVLGALPLATAGIVALAVVTALFGTVNGITLAFGFTLIGVAIDYPIFLFSHRLPGVPATATARLIWPTLAIAVGGIAIAYLAFLLSGVTGLVELACFNVAGIVAAGLTTRYLLPRLTPAAARDAGTSRLAVSLDGLAARLPRMPWLAPLLAVVGVGLLLLAPGPLWQNDLSRLTPVPQPLLRRYAALQRELGQPDIRYLMAVSGASAEQVLEAEERLRGGLRKLVDRHAIAGFEDAVRFLPSAATQERRRAALPGAAELKAALGEALRGTAFRQGLFEPFLTDIGRARQLKPLTPRGLAGTPLELSIGSLLLERGGGWTGLVTFTGVRDPAAVRALAAASGGTARLLDLKQASEGLVARQRGRILWSIGAAAVLLVIVVLAALRSARRALRVLVPIGLTTLLILAVLRISGISLNLFHLVALVLGAGLGLDYGLFFERSSFDPAGRRRTLHALLVCATAACIVFAVLASSPLPVLRSIGITVVLGVAGNFCLALLLIRPMTRLEASACSIAKPSRR
ncbi:MAG: MMPL family transporter [Steroidobacteraceae bacterium]